MKKPEVDEISAELSPWEEVKATWSDETTSHFEASWAVTTPDRGVFLQLRLDRWRLGASSEEIVSDCACAVAVCASRQRADLSLCAWSRRRRVSLSMTLTEARLEFRRERWLAAPATHFRRTGVASASSCTVDVQVVDVGAGPDFLCCAAELIPIQ